ncbi:hypothetical protein [Roseovarius nanhaiticus]|uniref:Cytochrome C oxidase assembly protein n=1 Tax=Roseovarius nanhaiticus TaxID=573024 RepID=A0A1N7FJD4_9RHOB|nr:hypothetical protein [Roseovarius nanhaiticus]SEK53291.1 hypothetical protein SAMN05216208_1045 [Roseovarius nanhaiticus]SIS00394.1 hypothetical protein SAMN05421666_1091 [Roseovarius nanhaiticus]
MAFFRKSHEMHSRRFSRNLGLGVVLAAFVALVFGLTVAKVSQDEFVIPDTAKGAGYGD